VTNEKETSMKPDLLPFSDHQAALENVGGKGLSHEKMTNGSLKVL